MKEKEFIEKGLAVLSALVLMIAVLFTAPVRVSAEEVKEEAKTLVTPYAELWTSTEIAVKVGETVKWYVTVPEDTEPKGCGATIKIPGLGFGTDTHNKEEGHIVLQKGENFIYEFTPEKTGDILFTCWMGSGCHANYIHVTESGTYSVPRPADPGEITAVRDGDKTVVSFKAPEAPEGSVITGYTVTATAEDGTRKKASGTESPITLEGLDESKTYTIVVVTKSTSGKSEGKNQFVLEAVKAEDAPAGSDEGDSTPADDTPAGNDDTSDKDSKDNDSGADSEKEKPSENTSDTVPAKPEEQEVVTQYDDLWTGNITVKAGVHVKWYVYVPEGTALNGCAKTIKIPGLGWGTDSHNKNEGHLTLETGKNFVYEFTPEKTGDILFTCWMGSGCHYNYIHVTADGLPSADADTGSGNAGSHGDADNTDAGHGDETGASDDSKADADKDTSSDTDTSSGKDGDNGDNKDVKKDEKPSADSSSSDTDGGAKTGSGSGSGSGSGGASSTYSAPKVASGGSTDSAPSDAGQPAGGESATAPQSTVSGTAANSNPDTGVKNVCGITSLAILLLGALAAKAGRKKTAKED